VGGVGVGLFVGGGGDGGSRSVTARLRRRLRSIHIDTPPQLLPPHQKHIQHTRRRHRRKRDQSSQRPANSRTQALQAGNSGVQAQSDTAGGGDGEHVRLDQCGGGEGRGFICVGVVDPDVEGLVGDLPGDCACGLGEREVSAVKRVGRVALGGIEEREIVLRETYAKIRRQHACGDDEVGEDEAGHAKGEKDWFAIVCAPLA